MKKTATAIVAGLVVSALGWIDPLFIPLVLAGPLISGALAATRNVRFRYVSLTWAVAGIGMIVSDGVINHEDVGFHTVLTVVMVGLAAISWAPARALSGRRTRAVA